MGANYHSVITRATNDGGKRPCQIQIGAAILESDQNTRSVTYARSIEAPLKWVCSRRVQTLKVVSFHSLGP